MAVLMAGNELEILSSVGSAAPTSHASVCLAGVNRSGIYVESNSIFSAIEFPQSLRSGWLRCRVFDDNYSNSINSRTGLRLVNESGENVLWTHCHPSGASPNNYTVRTIVDDSNEDDLGVYLRAPARYMDFEWVIDDTEGVFRVYVDETPVYEFTGDTLGAATSDRVARFEFKSAGAYSPYLYIGHFILSTTPTFGGEVYTLPITGDGTLDAWEGDYEDVNGEGLTLAGMTATFNNQTNTFTHTAMPALPGGVDINAVIVSTTGRYADNSEVNGQSGVVYDGVGTAETPAALVGFPSATPLQHVMELDPTNGQEWNVGAINAYEFGVRSKLIV